MAIFGESVSERLQKFQDFSAAKLVPTVPLSDAASPALVQADQEKLRDAMWQLENEVIMDRNERDLSFALQQEREGNVTHDGYQSERIARGLFWFEYLTPEQKKKFQSDPVELTKREKTEAEQTGRTDTDALADKKKTRLTRKAHLLNREREITWKRAIDIPIWRRLNHRFFLESQGIKPQDIDAELPQNFLGTFDRNEEMYNFLLGVGWNQILIDIFDHRRRIVDETREIMSQRIFHCHWDDLKNSEDKQARIKNLFYGQEQFGNTADLMRIARINKGVEFISNAPDNQEKALGLINEKVLPSKGKITSLNGFTSDQQVQLNNRSNLLFGDDFLNLTAEEQLMTTAGPGEILSLEEIMTFIGEYQVPLPADRTGKTRTKIRISSVDSEYSDWVRLGWVSMVGPWRLADRINKIIFTLSAREDQAILQRNQVDNAGMSGFGKYTYFDYDMYEAFYGTAGVKKRKTLLEKTVDQVSWPEGFWEDYQKGQKTAYKKYLEKATITGDQPLNFDEFCFGTLGVGSYQKTCQEWFLLGWRRIAEGVYLRLRGAMVEQAAKWGGNAEEVKKALEQDIYNQKITPAGEELLVERFNKSQRGPLLDIFEMIKSPFDKEGHGWTRFGNAAIDLIVRQFGLNLLLKKMTIPSINWNTSPAEIFNWTIVLPALIRAFVPQGPVTLSLLRLSYTVPGGWGAAWPILVAFLGIAGGVPLLRSRLVFFKDIGEKRWAKQQEKMDERAMALAEKPTRALKKTNWDPKQASFETHEPIKII